MAEYLQSNGVFIQDLTISNDVITNVSKVQIKFRINNARTPFILGDGTVVGSGSIPAQIFPVYLTVGNEEYLFSYVSTPEIQSQTTTGQFIVIETPNNSIESGSNVGVKIKLSITDSIHCTPIVNNVAYYISNVQPPVVEATITDETGLKDWYEKFISGQSIINVDYTVTLDERVPNNEVTGVKLLVNDKEQRIGGIFEYKGSSAIAVFKVIVTDKTGTEGSTERRLWVTEYNPPTISSLTVERYSIVEDEDGTTHYEFGDDGDRLDVSMDGTVYYLGSKTQWTLSGNYEGLEEPGTHVGTTNAWGLARTYFNKKIFPDTAPVNKDITITFELSDGITSITRIVTVPRFDAVFDVEKTGVAVGMRSSGSVETPLFQVAYPAYFLNGIYDASGNNITGGNYSLTEEPCGMYLGKALYRKVVEIPAFTSASTSGTTKTITTQIAPSNITKMDGILKYQDGTATPLNYYYSTANLSTCNAIATNNGSIKLTVKGSSICSGGYAYIEYTKE